ncbi:MAG: hypothetical protein ACRDSR_15170 [Pseudonocardiaceae bacterium]
MRLQRRNRLASRRRTWALRDDRWCVWFLDATTRSWARFDYQPDTRRWPVHQYGPRRLFTEVTAAYQCWAQAGRPSVTRWRFIITPAGQRVELAPPS